MRTFFTEHSSEQQNEIALNKIQNNKQIALFACDIACSVLPLWLKEFPNDKIVSNLLQTTENYLFDLTDLDQLRIARNNAVYYASNAVFAASNAAFASYDQWNFIYQLYLQTFKPNHIIIPKLPIFLELAQEIKSIKNFTLYNVLTDAILDYSNIKINTHCLGLSNWLLFYLLLKD